jgi:quercetin dioxygenase-like cupin family protein
MPDLVTVDTLAVRSHDSPDEVRQPDRSKIEINNMGEFSIGRFRFDPGWTWAGSVKPVAGTDHCEKNHVGYCVSGEIEVWTVDGQKATIKGGDSYTIPPGHDAKVVGDQPFIGVEFSSAATYAKK